MRLRSVLVLLAPVALASCLSIERPRVAEVEPVQGQAGTEVVIRGERFIDDFSRTRVFFGALSAPASNIVSISPTEIVVEVPVGAVTGDLVVSVGGVRSVATPFTVFGPWLLTGSGPARSVTVFDTHTGLVQGVLPFEGTPVDAAFAPFGDLAWVLAREGDAGFAVPFSPEDRTLDEHVDVLLRPDGLTFDPIPPDLEGRDPLRSEAWVRHEDSGNIVILESEGPSARRILEYADPVVDIAFSLDGSQAYLLQPGVPRITILGADVEEPVTVAEIGISADPGPMVVHASTGKIYVLEKADERIAVIDPDPEVATILTSIDVSPDPVDLVLSGDLLFVSSRGASEIQVIDVNEDAVIDAFPADPPPGELVSLLTVEGTRLFAFGPEGTDLVGYDALTLEEAVRRTPDPGIVAALPVVGSTGTFLYLAHEGDPGQITILEEPDGTVREVEVDPDPAFLALQ